MIDDEMSEEKKVSVGLALKDGYVFEVGFEDDLSKISVDEPRPVGRGAGPTASALILAGVGNCLSASLVFCLRRARADVESMKTGVTGTIARNEQGRWRITHIDVRIAVSTDASHYPQLRRCVEIFEDFCIVTASIRKGIGVDVEILA